MSALHGATCLAGTAAAFNVIFSRGLIGNDGNSSMDEFRTPGCDCRTLGRGALAVLGAELDIHGPAGRVEEFKLIAPTRRVPMADDGTGLDAATASIRFQTLCVLAL